MKQHLVLVLSLSLSSLLPAQSASYTNFGQGCGFPPIMPQLSATSLPRLGTTCVVSSGAAAWFRYRTVMTAILVSGPSNTSWMGTPLPVAIPYIEPWWPGSPFCNLLVAPSFVQAMWLGDSALFAIPNDPRLIGVTLYQQWLGWVQETTPTGLLYWFLASDGGAMRIGT